MATRRFRTGLRFAVFTLAVGTAGLGANAAVAQCKVIEHQGLCETDWLTNSEFWSGSYTAFASPSLHRYDGMPTVWRPEPFGQAVISGAGGVMQIETATPLHIAARPARPGNEIWEEHGAKLAESWNNLLGFRIDAHGGKDFSLGTVINNVRGRACSDAPGHWFALVHTTDGMPMGLYLFTVNPRLVIGHLTADTEFKGAQVWVSQILLFVRATYQHAGMIEVTKSAAECKAICGDQPWRCVSKVVPN